MEDTMSAIWRKKTFHGGAQPAGEDGAAYLLMVKKLRWKESSNGEKWWHGTWW
jgi:hypothetical protein